MFKLECIFRKVYSSKHRYDDTREIEHTKLLLKIFSAFFHSLDITLFEVRVSSEKFVTRPRSAPKLYNSTVDLENLMQIL